MQTEPKIKEVNINEVLNRALELGIHAGSKENTRVEKDLQPLPTLMVDPDQLEQVFLNLIMNALQAMPQGGTLTLRTYMENRELKIAVKDTGCGISPENLNKSFPPVFSTKKEVKGVGLGLSVSYGIIQGLKGRIEVDSKVGEGTTFTVCLPITQG